MTQGKKVPPSSLLKLKTKKVPKTAAYKTRARLIRLRKGVLGGLISAGAYNRGAISAGAYIRGGLYPWGLISAGAYNRGAYIRGGLYPRGLISAGAYIRGGL